MSANRATSAEFAAQTLPDTLAPTTTKDGEEKKKKKRTTVGAGTTPGAVAVRGDDEDFAETIPDTPASSAIPSSSSASRQMGKKKSSGKKKRGTARVARSAAAGVAATPQDDDEEMDDEVPQQDGVPSPKQLRNSALVQNVDGPNIQEQDESEEEEESDGVLEEPIMPPRHVASESEEIRRAPVAETEQIPLAAVVVRNDPDLEANGQDSEEKPPFKQCPNVKRWMLLVGVLVVVVIVLVVVVVVIAGGGGSSSSGDSANVEDGTGTTTTPQPTVAPPPETTPPPTSTLAPLNPPPPPTPEATLPPAVSGAPFVIDYQARWFGVQSGADSCQDPLPGIRITCGEGGTIALVTTNEFAACQPSGTNELVCSGDDPEADELRDVFYSCGGETAAAATTRVEAIPDDSVACATGGIVATILLVGLDCVGLPETVYDRVECDPAGSETVDLEGNAACLTFITCLAAVCNLASPPVAASISEASIPQECLAG